ncbi:MAG: DUF192 domain-containing protein [Candidatus Nanohaloarchaea archaeon]
MKIKVEDQELNVELADNLLKRAWGLSLRNEGKMLFKFPRPTKAKIDMVLLSVPLYLYFFDSEKELIHTEKAMPWGWNPRTWAFYRPEKRYQYLLESFENLGLEKGDKLNLS